MVGGFEVNFLYVLRNEDFKNGTKKNPYTSCKILFPGVFYEGIFRLR